MLIRTIFVFILSFQILSGFAFANDKPYKIAFVIPRAEDDMFFRPVVGFMRAAAEDLGVELVVLESKDNHLLTKRLVENALKGPNPVDAVIAVSVKDSGLAVLKVCEAAKIPVIIEDGAIIDPAAGAPREHYKYYIGEILPDDEMAGYELAKALFKNGKNNPAGKISVLGFNGPNLNSAAVAREKGLQRAIKEAGNVDLKQVVSARWEPETAKIMFKGLKQRYPDANVIWSASDGMALGVIAAGTEMKLQAGKDFITGGIDWSNEGIDALKKGQLDATVGGHFMEAAWALIIMNDYLNGIDFAKSDGLRMKTDMIVLNRENVDEYAKILNSANWKSINFKKLSKKYNPKIQTYDFSIKHVLKGS